MAYSKQIRKFLDNKNLLTKGTWRAPNILRLKSIWQEMWFILPFLLLTLVVTVGFWSAAAAQGALWVLIAFSLVVGGMGIWGALWFGHFHWRPSYTVMDVTVHFDDPDWYVDPEVMEAFLKEIFAQWDKAEVVDFDSKQLLKGSHLYLQKERPVDPLKRVEPERMVGLTYPGRRQSYVYAPYALTHGGAGYELRLQMVHVLLPHQTEEEDIVWMTDKEVI